MKPKNHGGDSVTKRQLHYRVEDERGKATEYKCVDCGDNAQDWTQINGTTGLDVYAHYNPRCKKCHWKYDQHLHVIGPGGPSFVRGEQNGASKLTEADVLEIREMLLTGMSQHDIAHIYDVAQGTISRIKLRITWNWLNRREIS